MAAFQSSAGRHHALQRQPPHGFNFIYSPIFQDHHHHHHHHGDVRSSSALSAASADQLYRGAGILKDYSSDAVRFFTEIRIPAAFLLGTSFVLVFALSSQAKDSELKRNTPLQNGVLLLYHVMALVSFLLSLNVVLSSTAASITLLLGVENPVARSTYELLNRELNFEFLMTRFSFYASMYTFLGAITLRTLMEFELLSKKRIRSALVILLSMASLVFHWTSHVNQSLYSCPNLFLMSIQVVKSFFRRAFTVGKTCETFSFACFVGAMLLLGQLVLRIGQFSEEDDDTSGSTLLSANETATLVST
jgi:hypothetical protein